MDTTALMTEYQSLPPAGQIEALVRLAHELTILGRDAYEPSAPGLSHPERLRALNEVQHRVISHALALLAADPARYPDEVIVALLLEHDDRELRRQVAAAFARSLASQAVVER